MRYRRAQAILLALLVALPLLRGFPTVQAESYALTITPPSTQEANSPGVTLSLTVTGADIAFSYAFDWVVRDPPGNTKNTPSSSTGGQSSFTLNVVYPDNFGGGAAIEFVGTYNVFVLQTNPPKFDPLVKVGSFDVGLTDKVVYARTESASIKATSYAPSEDVTINVTRAGNRAPGFPLHVFADSKGDIAHIWQTGPSTETGDYDVTLYGSITPPKSPPDSQTFRVNPATLGVTVTAPAVTLGPGQFLAISVNVTYPNGSNLTQGSVTATLSSSGSLIGSQILLDFDQPQSRWVGSYSVKENDPTGIWLVLVSASDPYGNTGQGSASAFASIPPPQQSPLTSFWFLTVLAAAGAGLALGGFLTLRRKKTTRHRLKVDLQAVGREADNLKNQEFFKSIQGQLNRKKDSPGEKSDR